MNSSLAILEMAVIALGLGLLVLDLWTPRERKRDLGYVAAIGLALIFVFSFALENAGPKGLNITQESIRLFAFNKMFLLDGLALFFKRFFLLAAFVVLLMSVDFADRIAAGIAEFYALLLFALSGMMLAASANDFILVFVILELITITFYVLTSFQRSRLRSLEAGVKYLILGALSSAFMIYGIALVFGMANTTNFDEIVAAGEPVFTKPLFRLGLLLVLVGLGFKIAAFPFQMWAPDVYQGAPMPVTAFLAIGSKAAGFVLLMRVLFSAVPEVTLQWAPLFVAMAGITILYGNLCAIPQRNLKRLLGYSSIANAGYLLLGVAAGNAAGSSAILYYLSGYLFTVLAAFTAISVVVRHLDDEDISAVAGLHQRSPLLAATLALAMISLAGIPPLAGFFGKFLLLKAVLERGATQPLFGWLLAVALVGIVISFYYYLGVVRAVYWTKGPPDASPIEISRPIKWSLCGCMAGMFYLGLFPNAFVNLAGAAVKVLRF